MIKRALKSYTQADWKNIISIIKLLLLLISFDGGEDVLVIFSRFELNSSTADLLRVAYPNVLLSRRRCQVNHRSLKKLTFLGLNWIDSSYSRRLKDKLGFNVLCSPQFMVVLKHRKFMHHHFVPESDTEKKLGRKLLINNDVHFTFTTVIFVFCYALLRFLFSLSFALLLEILFHILS